MLKHFKIIMLFTWCLLKYEKNRWSLMHTVHMCKVPLESCITHCTKTMTTLVTCWKTTLQSYTPSVMHLSGLGVEVASLWQQRSALLCFRQSLKRNDGICHSVRMNVWANPFKCWVLPQSLVSSMHVLHDWQMEIKIFYRNIQIHPNLEKLYQA